MKEEPVGASVTSEAISPMVGEPPRSWIGEAVRPVDHLLDC
jgi:hypothetical protein